VKFPAIRATRREFIGQMAAGAVVVEVAPLATGHAVNARPCVSFFLDQPYWDPTGLERPYRPSRGLRSGQPLAELTEEELRSAFGWL
jgi:hypothetical protein